MTTLPYIQAQWTLGKVPVIDGVLFGDGRVELVTLQVDHPAVGKTHVELLHKRSSSLDEVAASGKLTWTAITVLCKAIDDRRGLHVCGGEGGLGADGFVALSLSDGQLQWIAFFDNANPFVSIGLLSGQVVGTTNHGDRWIFPLASPVDIQIDMEGSLR